MNRSYLFVPASNAGMLFSSMILPADAIIFDLEDAVAYNQKDAARTLLAHALETLEFNNKDIFVRVNQVTSPAFLDDIRLCYHPKVTGIVLPKATLHAVAELQHQLQPMKPVILLIESALGVIQLTHMCEKVTHCVGLLLGGEDLSRDCGVERTVEGHEIDYARKHLVLHAKAYGWSAIDTPYLDIENLVGLKKETTYAIGLGYDAKVAINPRQIDTIHEAFAISQDALRNAQAIVDVFTQAQAQGIGVFAHEGKMIDEPVYQKALKIVQQAQRQRGKQ